MGSRQNGSPWSPLSPIARCRGRAWKEAPRDVGEKFVEGAGKENFRQRVTLPPSKCCQESR